MFFRKIFNVFSGLKNKYTALSKKEKAVVIASAVGCAVAAFSGFYALVGLTASDDSPTAKKKEVKTVEVASTDVDVPTFSDFTVSSDSLEKDLNLYVTDVSGNKVTGVPFQFKLLSPSDAKQLSSSVDTVTRDNQKLAAADAAGLSDQAYTKDTAAQLDAAWTQNNADFAASLPETDGSTETEIASSSHVNAATGSPLTVKETLLVQKNNDIASYGEALSKLDGKLLSDDDQDGMIYADGLDAGDYTVCFVPLEGYAATNDTSSVTVKDKVEYKPVANIKNKVEKSVPDPQPQEDVPTEASLSNTVAFVDSRTDQSTDFSNSTAPQVLAASCTRTSTGGTATVYACRVASASTVALDEIPAGYTAAVTSNSNGNAASVSISNPSGSGASGTVTTTASASQSSDANVTAVVSYTPDASAGQSSYTKTYQINVKGSSGPLYASDGTTALYLDSSGTQRATIGDYGAASYYYPSTETKYYGWQTVGKTRYYYDGNGNKVTGTQVIEGVTYHFGSDGALLTSGTGIDVSKWQGNIDWSQAGTAISFAIIRCGYRGSSGGLAVDPKYVRNIKNAKANGVSVGLYIYSNAHSEAQAVEEASLAVMLANQQGGVSLPIYIDMEGRMTKNSKSLNTAIANAFCATVRSAGYRAGVYASYSFFLNHLNTPGISDASLWCARYNTYCGLPYSYDIWQYTSKGSIPGISGNVDMDISYF